MLAIPRIGSADPKPPVGAHRHFIVKPDGTLVPVGPDLCDNPTDPAVQQAFYNFHWNVHKGADGLVNGLGAEITSRGCSFVLPTSRPTSRERLGARRMRRAPIAPPLSGRPVGRLTQEPVLSAVLF